MATVILVRHGRTTANASGLLAGRAAGVRLDQTGRDQAAEAYMHTLVDEARAEQGLGPLRPVDDVADVAASWSAEMATTRHFVHNPRHADQICCWTQVAENIAWSDPPRTRLLGDPVATVVQELHEALLASPATARTCCTPSSRRSASASTSSATAASGSPRTSARRRADGSAPRRPRSRLGAAVPHTRLGPCTARGWARQRLL